MKMHCLSIYSKCSCFSIYDCPEAYGSGELPNPKLSFNSVLPMKKLIFHKLLEADGQDSKYIMSSHPFPQDLQYRLDFIVSKYSQPWQNARLLSSDANSLFYRVSRQPLSLVKIFLVPIFLSEQLFFKCIVLNFPNIAKWGRQFQCCEGRFFEWIENVVDIQNLRPLALIRCTREPLQCRVLQWLDCRRIWHKVCLLQGLLNANCTVWFVWWASPWA